ncbi:MAG: GMP synthase-like glutamine amidotransferase [Parasphingorhabdus sp.]|jgi:GMP synthase-like glutamine amidotransferase
MKKPEKMHILIFQHVAAEHVGRFGALLEADGVRTKVVSLDQGEAIPELNGYDGLWVLGGPMQVWQEKEFPWLIAEKAAIREAVVERQLPYFGLCLGHQLLADSLGGEVGISATPEVGVLPVTLTEAGRNSVFFKGAELNFNCIQGHGAEVKTPPAHSEVLAYSDRCSIQALAYGHNTVSMQFHSELTLEMIDACLELPEYKADFEALLGLDGIEAFRKDCIKSVAMFDADAKLVYQNWMKCATSENIVWR